MPGEHRRVVQCGREMEAAIQEMERIEAGEDQRTPLTAYFTLNQTLGEEVERYTFLSISRMFRYDRPKNEWIRRQQHRKNHLTMLEATSPGNLQEQVNNKNMNKMIYISFVRHSGCW